MSCADSVSSLFIARIIVQFQGTDSLLSLAFIASSGGDVVKNQLVCEFDLQ